MHKTQNHHRSCPYIGLSYDQVTYSNFPSIHNVCYHTQPSATPNYSHQRVFCLTNNFSKCPIYSEPEGRKFFQELKQEPEKKGKTKTFIIFGFFIALIFLILLVIYWKNNRVTLANLLPSPTIDNLVFTSTKRVTKTCLTTFSVSPTSTKPAITTLSALKTVLQTLSPSLTSTEVLFFRLDHPIGKNPQFIIHRAIEGESLELYADLYQTSAEAIRNINENLPRILWIDQIVIIPLNQSDVSGIPSFIAFEIEEETTDFNQIADEFFIPFDDLLRYNNADGNYILHRGDWILIPQTIN